MPFFNCSGTVVEDIGATAKELHLIIELSATPPRSVVDLDPWSSLVKIIRRTDIWDFTAIVGANVRV